MKDTADQDQAGESPGAAASGLDRSGPEGSVQEQVPEQRAEKRAHDGWEELAELIKRRAKDQGEQTNMDVAGVKAVAEDVYWEEIIDKNMEDKMISEVREEKTRWAPKTSVRPERTRSSRAGRGTT